MRRFGIFVAYSPNQLNAYQGISRLIGFLVKGALDGDIKVTIASPAWLKGDIISLLEDAGISIKSVELLSTRSEPHLVRFWRWSNRTKQRKRSGRRLLRTRLAPAIGLGIVDWLSSASWTSLILGSLTIILASLVFALPLLGFLFCWGIYKIFRRAMQAIQISSFGRVLRYAIKRLKMMLSSPAAVDRLRANEIGKLIRLMNRRKDISTWYVPTMFWPEIEKIDARVVVAAPDLVLYEHSAQFISEIDERAFYKILRSLQAADHLICYSDYVKKSHYVEKTGISPAKISVIPHGFIDMSATADGGISRERALEILHEHIKKNREWLPKYLCGYRFDDVPFLFYSSQDRPHKNLEFLIRAYEKLLRERYRPLKLVLTARLDNNRRIVDLLDARGLRADVLSFHSVPANVLAALYRLAALCVNPTLFEGGFPFTFSEGYSLGTPSIMSRIPVVREQIQDLVLLDRMTFDPFNVDDLVAKIEWALDNRQALTDMQRPLFASLSMRSWHSVANEYMAVLQASDI